MGDPWGPAAAARLRSCFAPGPHSSPAHALHTRHCMLGYHRPCLESTTGLLAPQPGRSQVHTRTEAQALHWR